MYYVCNDGWPPSPFNRLLNKQLTRNVKKILHGKPVKKQIDSFRGKKVLPLFYNSSSNLS
jgi:hypothetical protein